MTIKRTVQVIARFDGTRVVWAGNVRMYEDGLVLGLPLRAHLYSVDVTLADVTGTKR